MARLTPDQAAASLARLESAIGGMPAAAARSGKGTHSTIEMIGMWRDRIATNDMSPDALPDLYHRQAGRHARRAPELADALTAEERALRRQRGESTGYGAAWYFGAHRTADDDD